MTEELLRWRTAQAAAEAPPVPRAARLLELMQPWWEKWPDAFTSLVQQLRTINLNYGHASVEGASAGSGYPVPTVVACGDAEMKVLADILYLNIRDKRLRLRFQLKPALDPVEARVEVTFVAPDDARALFVTPAILAAGDEYRVDAELPAEFVPSWAQFKVTDRMPFRFIVRTVAT